MYVRTPTMSGQSHEGKSFVIPAWIALSADK